MFNGGLINFVDLDNLDNFGGGGIGNNGLFLLDVVLMYFNFGMYM